MEHQSLLDWKVEHSPNIDFYPNIYNKFRSKHFSM